MLSAARRPTSAPLVAVLIALFAGFSYGQKLPLKSYTTADGLATSVIHSAMRDSQGFLWFTGRGGISRFDGHEFVSYELDDESTPLVHGILESRDRTRFWIATDNGLYRVERGEIASPTVSDRKLPHEVRRLNARKVSDRAFWALFEQADGTLLGGFDTLHESGDPNGDTVEFRTLGLRDNTRLRIRDFLLDPDGSLWVTSDYALIRRLPDGRWIFYATPSVYGLGNESGRMVRDSRGNIWFPLRTGVFVYHPEPIEALAGLPHQHEIKPPTVEQNLGASGSLQLAASPGVMTRLIPSVLTQTSGAGSAVAGTSLSLFQASDGRIWYSTKDNLYVIDGDSYRTSPDAAERPGIVSAMTEDLVGDIWFGTPNGLYRLMQDGLTSYDRSSGLIEPDVQAIYEMPDGRLIIGHGRWRVSELTESRFETSTLNLLPNARPSWTGIFVVPDAVGSLWVMEYFGVYQFKKLPRLRDQTAQTPIKRGGGLSYRAFNDKRGHIWITGLNDVNQFPLSEYDPIADQWTDYSQLEGFPKGRAISTFAEDKLGRIWMGLYGGGMVRLENGKFVQLSAEDGVPKGSIFGTLIDRSGRLWIGSSEEGIVRIDDPYAEKPEIKRITEADGLSSNNVRCLAEDSDGNIYLGTVRGVSQIDGATGAVRVFTTANGLAGDFVQVAYRDRNGVMWFGTSNGLSRYRPGSRKTSPGREVFISSLEVAGNVYAISEFGQRTIDDLELSSSENNIRIAFTSVGDALKFQYKIEGANELDWTEPTSERTLNFANLSPGAYRLLVRTVDSPTLEPASVKFTIRPPFWRTWWFMVLAFLAVGGAVFGLDRYRVAKTRQVKFALAKSVESESRFRTLAQTASDAIITIEEDSTIVYVNEAVERVFGYEPEEIVGKKLTDLMPERMRGAHGAGLARYVKTSVKNIGWNGVTLPGLRKDGTEVPLELSFGEFELDGKRYFTGIARDITQRLEAEQALRIAREERMRELQKVRSRIATDLHDDIGSSLTQIAVLSEVARGQASALNADGVSTPLERIKNVSKELVAVMSDIVWAINPQKDYLNDLVQRMRRFGSDILSGRGIGFEFSAPEREDAFELGANIRREVFAIFKETVNNAAKYSQCSKVVAVFGLNDDRLTLRITDDGIGFDTAVVLSDDFRPDMGGNGLVSIRRRAVELGGTCDIRSAPGQGTDIALSIPLGPRQNGS